jgi:ATP-dependent RNA helicase DHX37/DHR1
MSVFPLSPRYSKMIILGQQFNNMPYIIAIVAGLSVGDPFIGFDELESTWQAEMEVNQNQNEAEIKSEPLSRKRRDFERSRAQFDGLDRGCDILKLLCAIGAYECANGTNAFCRTNFLRIKLMRDIHRMRIQITNIVNNQLAGIVTPVQFTPDLPPPSPIQMKTMKQVVAAAFLDHIAIRSDLLEAGTSKSGSSKNILRVPYTRLSDQGSAEETAEVYIHPNSALAAGANAPEYVVYSDVRQSQQNGRLRILPLSSISARDIEPLARGTPLIQYSKPLNYPPARVFTANGVMRRETHVTPRLGIKGRGWELPSIKRIETLTKT